MSTVRCVSCRTNQLLQFFQKFDIFHCSDLIDYIEKSTDTASDCNTAEECASGYLSTHQKALKQIQGLIDSKFSKKVKLHFHNLYDQLDCALHDNDDEYYKKWLEVFMQYLKLKTKSWKLKEESKEMVIICRICEKKFMEAVFKEHSAECYELNNWKNELQKKNAEVTKLCELAFEKKQELSVNAVIEKYCFSSVKLLFISQFINKDER